VRFATWNVNSLTARLDRVSEWITAHHPDVLCMQETKQDDAKFPHAAFTELGYEAVHHGEGRWNGVAIASKVGLDTVVRGFGTEEDEHGARVVSAVCAGVDIVCCYVPNGRALDDPFYEKKLAWLDRLAVHVGEVPASRALIVAGDFNVAPQDLDVWDPAALEGQTHVTPAERDRVQALVALGLDDVVRTHLGDEQVFSWWDYRNGSFHRGWGLRIDLVLCSAAVANGVTSARVDRNARKGVKPSDHAPVVVDFEWDHAASTAHP
jgi:exodeoxyribonuclease-3